MIAEVLPYLLGLATIANRIVETTKQRWADQHKDAEGKPTPPPAWFTLLTSMVVGIVMAGITQMNLFRDATMLTVPPLLGIVLSGLAIGVASNALHPLQEIMAYFKPTKTSTSTVTVTSEATTPADTINSAPPQVSAHIVSAEPVAPTLEDVRRFG